ncbi:MAG TPA: hypothetical protein VMV97_02915 [Sulfuriferula sp.]|nr:hypothetical protein [Sulfuriferula sp.]
MDKLRQYRKLSHIVPDDLGSGFADTVSGGDSQKLNLGNSSGYSVRQVLETVGQVVGWRHVG